MEGEQPLFCRITGPKKPDVSKSEDREWLKQKHWAQGLIVRVVDDLHTTKYSPDVPVYGVIPMERQGIIPEPYNFFYGFVIPGPWLEPVHASEIQAEGWQFYEHPQLGRQVYPMPDKGKIASLEARPGFHPSKEAGKDAKAESGR